MGAALKDKSLPALAVRVVERNCTLVKTVATEQQLFEVLARPYLASLIAPLTYDWLRKMRLAAEVVEIA
jgi:hypothetical protein